MPFHVSLTTDLIVLHLHEDEMLTLGDNNKQHVPLVKYLHAMTKYSFNVCSFFIE